VCGHFWHTGLRGARERIARLLLEIYVRVRRRLPAEPGEIIQLPLSQGHIGQALGLTYVHVCRTLQILREQKIVRFANHRLEIMDPPALMAAAGIEVDALGRLQPRPCAGQIGFAADSMLFGSSSSDFRSCLVTMGAHLLYPFFRPSRLGNC
jgi:hypothetical protein